MAHDCLVGNHTIFANGATLAGHVEVEDWATIGAFSGVHQFCRVGAHAFVGGYTVVTKDVLPYSKTVGNRACIYGVNSVGLTRRGFTPERVAAIRRAYRVLLQSRLNTSEALARLEADGPASPEDVRALVDFIRSSPRGVILKRHQPRTTPSEERVSAPAAPAGPDRGQRALPVPGRRGRAPRRPPRGGGGHPRGGRRPSWRRRWTRCTGWASASSAAASTP